MNADADLREILRRLSSEAEHQSSEIDEIIANVSETGLEQCLHPWLSAEARRPLKLLTTGSPGAPGVASGAIVFDKREAERFATIGRRTVFVSTTTRANDLDAMQQAEGILTSEGGVTSHAAIVARNIGKPCVVGASSLRIDPAHRQVTCGSEQLHFGDDITVDGASGEVFAGLAHVNPAVPPSALRGLVKACRDMSPWTVRVNAELEPDLALALEFMADGVGVCRTEHMFLGPGRVELMWQLIAGHNHTVDMRIMDELLERQQADFELLFERMADRPVTIRLLDPPLHEFLPHTDEDIELMARLTGSGERQVRGTVASMREENPMLGHRGCRLGITHKEIYDVQVRAILSAAARVSERLRLQVHPEIMIPFVMGCEEFREISARIRRAEEALEVNVSAQIGAMIEIPRAAIQTDEIVRCGADFLSFGANDLTQLMLGISRDDGGAFLPDYQRVGIVEAISHA
jgi:pyruvate,orthophosphate dikinase